MHIERQLAVHDLNARYVEAIDEDRLEEWPDFFADDGKYRVTTAENVDAGPAAGPDLRHLARHAARPRQGVAGGQCLRSAALPPRARRRRSSTAARTASLRGAHAAFMVARIMHTGETMLFATGCYDDRVVLDGDGRAFAEKTVILDSRQIDTLLAIPLVITAGRRSIGRSTSAADAEPDTRRLMSATDGRASSAFQLEDARLSGTGRAIVRVPCRGCPARAARLPPDDHAAVHYIHEIWSIGGVELPWIFSIKKRIERPP